MLAILLVFFFVLGYLAIAFEHPLGVNKAASALMTGVLCWLIYFFEAHTPDEATEQLMHHLGDIASILFFLLGAMTIVEMIDSHNGFEIITQKIKTTDKGTLLVIVSVLTFFISALLDNLTTSIVMTSLCARILNDKEDKLWFAGMIVIAANAGGAWSPLGDVTTTMLWIGGQLTALNIMAKTFLASLAVCGVPLLILTKKFKGKKIQKPSDKRDKPSKESNFILLIGVGLLVFVPVFKTTTHMPPFMGMLLALSVIWVITTWIHADKQYHEKKKLSVATALQKIDTPSILFFLGILLAVAALESFGMLKTFAAFLDNNLKNDYLIGTTLGLLSAIVDNVPLVAAAQGMYDFNTFPQDHRFWEFLALTTGTGGSTIIIGSAAGVAVMGIENIDFMWYLKRISWLALMGFIAGIFVFIGQQLLLHT
ncbi:sodium:proton antiporter NhaD [Emticicia sp. BO119]|uniref:sodium:proton antiporter NhaD n=1 Tax=Emticicia sp. BO119 TaxID=2757768 RepID=UPI0015F0F24E|nr:sodium:proton antiporter NhaD [Emticicia sp. BO119]MBA4852147.1 sodium:proton antiporter NhaD [Emticicia sp. BO119]